MVLSIKYARGVHDALNSTQVVVERRSIFDGGTALVNVLTKIDELALEDGASIVQRAR